MKSKKLSLISHKIDCVTQNMVCTKTSRLFDLVCLQYSSSVRETYSSSTRGSLPSIRTANSILDGYKPTFRSWYTIYYFILAVVKYYCKPRFADKMGSVCKRGWYLTNFIWNLYRKVKLVNRGTSLTLVRLFKEKSVHFC